jgi:alkanesulfonate monooxygenase SsuD/methylene tetrahydromethanopterin reductase-like flavin-dependent oxidoreductase (luciferase family)
MLKFAFAESMCDPSQYLDLAKAAEKNRFSSFLVPDSICYPRDSDSTYPYTKDGSREFLDDKPFIETFIQIAAQAAVTSRIEFMPFVYKVPVRDPIVMAKQAMSLAVMSNNRFLFGMGLSPWPDDYQVTGTQWAKRGKRFDEMVEITRKLLGGGYQEFSGEFYQFPALKMTPVPSKPVPFIFGGHSGPALDRAARLGDGWAHAGGGGEDDIEDLKRMIARLHELRAKHNRTGPFRIWGLSQHAYTPEGVRMLEDAGVTDIGVAIRDPYTSEDTMSLQQKIDAISQYAEGMIPK